MPQKHPGKAKFKEYLIAAFVLVCSLLILADLSKNVVDEIRIASEFNALSPDPVKQQPENNPTLSEEEMKRWADRLEKHPDS